MLAFYYITAYRNSHLAEITRQFDPDPINNRNQRPYFRSEPTPQCKWREPHPPVYHLFDLLDPAGPTTSSFGYSLCLGLCTCLCVHENQASCIHKWVYCVLFYVLCVCVLLQMPAAKQVMHVNVWFISFVTWPIRRIVILLYLWFWLLIREVKIVGGLTCALSNRGLEFQVLSYYNI